MKKIFLKLFIIIPALIIFIGNLKQSELSGKQKNIKFIIFGNTKPASAYSGFSKAFPFIIKKINNENPLFVIHTGNIVVGGYKWMGINKIDIERQFSTFFSEISKLNSLFYSIAGEYDHFNGSLKLYSRYSGKKLNYSFNYGDIHFIILNTINFNTNIPSGQLTWLKKNLHLYRKSRTIIVLTHYPVFSQPRAASKFKHGEILHNIFIKYPVKAVFSGNFNRYYESVIDNIRYIAAGCSGFNNDDRYKVYNQFYVIDFTSPDINITKKRIKIPYQIYQQKKFLLPK